MLLARITVNASVDSGVTAQSVWTWMNAPIPTRQCVSPSQHASTFPGRTTALVTRDLLSTVPSVRMWMSVGTQMASPALSTHYVTTQQDPSSVCALLGSDPLARAARISTNARTTAPAALTRCAPTALDPTTAPVCWGITRRTRRALTPMNVMIHRVTSRHAAGTPPAPFHATARTALLETASGAETWTSVSP